jgi:hypothetical protein
MIHEPIKPSRIQRAKIIAQAAQQKVISGFDSDQAAPIDAAQEGAPAGDQTQSEKSHTSDSIIGALLFSLLAENQSEMVNEKIPSSERCQTP